MSCFCSRLQKFSQTLHRIVISITKSKASVGFGKKYHFDALPAVSFDYFGVNTVFGWMPCHNLPQK